VADGATSLASIVSGSAAEVACPHCGQTNPAVGAIIDCLGCDRSFVRAGTSSGSGFDPVLARSPTDVGLRITGAVAALITALFYLAVVQPLSGSYFAELFGARGWVPYVIAWLSAWAGVLLSVKAWLLAGQQRALLLDLLPDAIAARVTPTNSDEFRQHLRDIAEQRLPARRLPLIGAITASSRSFLVERLGRALERFRMRRSTEDVIDQLVTQSQLDANAVESSYTMIRVFIWAIPLLGFIGTVVGISAAVAGFSDSVASAVDLEVMKQSIGSVTTGLGVAFDTTLLALVMSIVIMFPASSLQKAEEDFLGQVDAYCDERLGRRVHDGANAQAPGAAAAVGLEALQEQLTRLARTIETLDDKLAARGPRRDD
jgi:biopolymer transport protein ExbB/TolQ